MNPNEFLRKIWDIKTINGNDIPRAYLFRMMEESIMYLFNFEKDIIMDDCSYLKIDGKRPTLELCLKLRNKSFKIENYDPVNHTLYFQTDYGLGSNKLTCFKSNTNETH